MTRVYYLSVPFYIYIGGDNKDDDDFDEIVGALQEIIMSMEFEELQINFLDKHYEIFENIEENKLEYT